MGRARRYERGNAWASPLISVSYPDAILSKPMYRKAFILLLLAACATTVIARSRSKPRQKEGDYNFTVAGYVHGSGTATVSGERIKLQANVTTDDGGTGELNA